MVNVFLLVLSTVFALNVFLIPHSHIDAGWIKTLEEYYSQDVKNILNNMLGLLEVMPSIKFVWSEISFLSMYLNEFPEKKSVILKYIKEKRFEIVGGGWVQNDEALPDFEIVLRQMEAGFEYLNRELNISNVRIGWQIDSFGHSSLTAALLEKMGYECMIISRNDQNYNVLCI